MSQIHVETREHQLEVFVNGVSTLSTTFDLHGEIALDLEELVTLLEEVSDQHIDVHEQED